MVRDIIIAMSAVFVLWVGAIFVSSLRLVTRNWWLFTNWRRQTRDTRVKMALWLGVPIMMAGLLWMRGIAIFNYLVVPGCCPTATFVQMLVYLPAILIGLALILWWVCDLSYNGDADVAARVHAAEKADRAWGLLMLAGAGLALATMTASWLL